MRDELVLEVEHGDLGYVGAVGRSIWCARDEVAYGRGGGRGGGVEGRTWAERDVLSPCLSSMQLALCVRCRCNVV